MGIYRVYPVYPLINPSASLHWHALATLSPFSRKKIERIWICHSEGCLFGAACKASSGRSWFCGRRSTSRGSPASSSFGWSRFLRCLDRADWLAPTTYFSLSFHLHFTWSTKFDISVFFAKCVEFKIVELAVYELVALIYVIGKRWQEPSFCQISRG